MNHASPKILCVDDEPANLTILEEALMPRGYEVIQRSNGREALAAINSQRIDAVILDVKIPEIDGYEVCKKIKEDERHRTIPVVMITGLSSKEDRIKGIEAGAEDFIVKPFDPAEVLTRIEMLLRMKELHDSLNSAYARITDLTGFGETMAASFDPLNFNFISSFDAIVNNTIRKSSDTEDRPQMIIVGFVDENRLWQWYLFESLSGTVRRTWLKLDIQSSLDPAAALVGNGFKKSFYNESDLERSAIRSFTRKIESLSIKATNAVCVEGATFCIFALNYNKRVTRHDAEVLNSIALQSLFLKSLAGQVKETEDSFDYLVHSLARAAEANDEDTGNHILRVGEYCALIAEELDMSEKFTSAIRLQATLHDVGKIHVHPDILRKPAKLTSAEYDEIKKHTVYGARILGDHVRLALAKTAALSHHERWDGSGYPYGLRGEQIPLEGRILNIADQYDALRNKRVYKPAFDHQTAYNIITDGDGRTMPHHFDPQILRVFKETASRFEGIYDSMKG